MHALGVIFSGTINTYTPIIYCLNYLDYLFKTTATHEHVLWAHNSGVRCLINNPSNTSKCDLFRARASTVNRSFNTSSDVMHFRLDFKCLVIAESAACVCSWLSSVSSFGGMCCLICSVSRCMVLPTYMRLQLHVYVYTIELFESVGGASFATTANACFVVKATTGRTFGNACVMVVVVCAANLWLMLLIHGNLIFTIPFLCLITNSMSRVIAGVCDLRNGCVDDIQWITVVRKNSFQVVKLILQCGR